jgi:hypothetical protein
MVLGDERWAREIATFRQASTRREARQRQAANSRP